MQILNQFGSRFKGTLGKAMTAATWHGRNYIRGYRKPANPKTTRQSEQRACLASAIGKWHTLVTHQKDAYKRARSTKARNITPYNAMVSAFMLDCRAGIEYEEPAYSWIEVRDSVTDDPIDNAMVWIMYSEAPARLWGDYTDANGKTAWLGLLIEEEPYSIALQATGYTGQWVQNLTAAEILTTHLMVPE